jgi:biotin transport system substrate-specific component
MAPVITAPTTIYGAFEPRTRATNTAMAILATVLASLLLAISAQIKVPLVPVPVTLATLAVALIAGTFGWRIGVASVALYIAEGLAGLPVFSSGGGFAYVLSPTFGFILGYLPMAYFIGRAVDSGLSARPALLIAAMVGANALLFVFGYLWLLALSGGAAWIDRSDVLGSAFAVAVKPFVLWDLLKMVLAGLTVSGLFSLVGRRA